MEYREVIQRPAILSVGDVIEIDGRRVHIVTEVHYDHGLYAPYFFKCEIIANNNHNRHWTFSEIIILHWRNNKSLRKINDKTSSKDKHLLNHEKEYYKAFFGTVKH